MGVKTLQPLLKERSNDTCKQTCTHTDPTTSFFPTSESTTLDMQVQGTKWLWVEVYVSSFRSSYCSGSIHDDCTCQARIEEFLKEGVDLVAVVYSITKFLFSNEIFDPRLSEKRGFQPPKPPSGSEPDCHGLPQ